MNLVQIFDDHVLKQPEHVALKDRLAGMDREITYRQLRDCAKRAAARLIERGIGKGSRILVAAPLSIETYVLLLAIFRIGAVVVIADPSLGLPMLRRSIAIAEPDAIIAGHWIRLFTGIFPEIANIKVKLDAGEIISPIGKLSKQKYDRSNGEIADLDGDHPALITFTSGSTGNPKAIVRSHKFLLHQQNVIATSLPVRRNDIELTTLPVFVLSALAQGITSVLPDCDMRRPGTIDAERILRQIKCGNVNRVIASPAFLQRLAEYLSEHQQELPGLDAILTGGGPVFPALLKSLETVFPNAEVTAVYGSTEAEPIAHINSRSMSKDDLEKTFAGGGLLAGMPIGSIELAIVDPLALNASVRHSLDTDIDTLPPFTTGEIIVCGEHVIKTYLNVEGDSETKFVQKSKIWHRTGDAGYLDGDGRLWLMGRCALKISDQWGELYPFQVEVAASELQTVRRATCLRADDKRILVVEKKHRTPFRWLADLLQHQAPYTRTIGNAFSWLRFDEIRLVYSMPVDARHNSKIRYQTLARRLRHAWTI